MQSLNEILTPPLSLMMGLEVLFPFSRLDQESS